MALAYPHATLGIPHHARVTDVRVQRLRDISAKDAEAEGVFRHVAEYSVDKVFRSEREATALNYFRDLWTSIHGPGSWEANPWVAAISFERVPPHTPSEGRDT